jgi:hypothetical protein
MLHFFPYAEDMVPVDDLPYPYYKGETESGQSAVDSEHRLRALDR